MRPIVRIKKIAFTLMLVVLMRPDVKSDETVYSVSDNIGIKITPHRNIVG